MVKALKRMGQWIYDELTKPRIGPGSEEYEDELTKEKKSNKNKVYKQFVIDFVNDHLEELAAEIRVEVHWPDHWSREDIKAVCDMFTHGYGFGHDEPGRWSAYDRIRYIDMAGFPRILRDEFMDYSLIRIVAKRNAELEQLTHTAAANFIAEHYNELKNGDRIPFLTPPENTIEWFYYSHGVGYMRRLGLFLDTVNQCITAVNPNVEHWEQLQRKCKED